MAAHTSANGLPVASGIELVPLRRLPDRFSTIFPFPFFNAIQSRCFPAIYHSSDNFVLSAPTGSGKTAILELAICSLIVNSPNPHAHKVIYQAPTKALCAERQRDWSKKFGPLGLTCQGLTGDTEQTQIRHARAADIIITTPEKWDSITRKWRDHGKLMDLVKLFLIDEVHILKDDRGASLEAVVSRMKSAGRNVRFVALSATVPNSEDIATWLGKNSNAQHLPALRQVFGEQFRPVRLEKHVLGLRSNAQNEWQFETACNKQLPEVIATYSARKPIMVFCFTRKSTQATAEAIAYWWQCTEPAARLWTAPGAVPTVGDSALNECMRSGVAFHHAGLEVNDRGTVEDAYLKGRISVLCCTSTLAVGVNLPCHLVIIKNTVTYHSELGSCREYSDLDIMQMLGRAGRPQFDDSATAVIMTRAEKVTRYEKMVQGQELLESRLHVNLIEHLNAEICLGTVSSINAAYVWLESTFLAIRLAKNPQHYKIQGDHPTETLQERVRQICTRDIDQLLRYGLASGEQSVRSTEYGDIMARYYILFDTMKLAMGLQNKAKISEILSAVALSSELKTLRFKGGEKQMYKDINNSPLTKYPIKVNLDLPANKVSLIIQATLGGIDVAHDERHKANQRQFFLDTSFVLQHAKRLINAIIDCKVEAKDAVAVRNALELARSLSAQAWDDSSHQLSQLEGLGPVAVRRLVSYDIRSIEDLENTESHKIDMALSKNPPFGANLLQKLKSFPKLRLSLKVVGKPVLTASNIVEIKVRAEVGFLNEQPPTTWKRSQVNVHFMAETTDGQLVKFARASAKTIGTGQSLDFTVGLVEANQLMNCYVACDDIAGTLKYAVLDPKVPAAMFHIKPNNDLACKDVKSAIKRLRSPSLKEKKEDFEDDDLDDNDMVVAAQKTQPHHFLDINDILSDEDGKTESTTPLSGRGHQRKPLTELNGVRHPSQPTTPATKPKKPQSQKSSGTRDWQAEKLSNGKWACSHTCRDKKACKHQCCKTGMDKPPRHPPKHEPEEEGYQPSTIWASFHKRKGEDVAAESADLPAETGMQHHDLKQLPHADSQWMSDESLDIYAALDNLDDMPLAKRRRTLDQQAETGARFATAEDVPLAGRQMSSGHRDNTEIQYEDIKVRDFAMTQPKSNRLEPLENSTDRVSPGARQPLPTLPADVSSQDDFLGDSNLALTRHEPTGAGLQTESAHEPPASEPHRKLESMTQDEEDATAWVLREFGDYVEIV